MDSVIGQNTDIQIQGALFHIQTEDWGKKDKILLSRIYQNGRVLKTFKLDYASISNCENSAQRTATLIRFHRTVLKKLRHSLF